jgi:thymidylate kinase
VTICGVDGTGKSTLAGRLSEELGPAFRRTLRLHWRPDLLPRLGAIVGRPPPDADRPHEGTRSGTITGLIRLLYYWMDHVLGYWLRIWPARVRSGLVIMERGFLDIKVDPRRYRMRAAGSLFDLLARAVPRPDVELVLAASPELVNRRKRELSGEEARRQVEEWARIANGSDRARLLDAGQAPSRVLEEALRSILERHR